MFHQKYHSDMYQKNEKNAIFIITSSFSHRYVILLISYLYFSHKNCIKSS